MNFVIDNWMLISVALSSGFLLAWPGFQSMSVAGVSAQEVVQKINREKAVVVDISSAEEFAQGHIVNARHVAFDQLEADLGSVAKNKAQVIILVCASGARAKSALAVVKKMGYEQSFCLQGGLKAWREASLPVVTA